MPWDKLNHYRIFERPTTSNTSRISGRVGGWFITLPPLEVNERELSKAVYLIYQSCSTIAQSHIADEKDPARMWIILGDLFICVNEDNEAGKALYEEFLAEQFHKYKAVDEYAAKLRNYQSQLANIM